MLSNQGGKPPKSHSVVQHYNPQIAIKQDAPEQLNQLLPLKHEELVLTKPIIILDSYKTIHSDLIIK